MPPPSTAKRTASRMLKPRSWSAPTRRHFQGVHRRCARRHFGEPRFAGSALSFYSFRAGVAVMVSRTLGGAALLNCNMNGPGSRQLEHNDLMR